MAPSLDNWSYLMCQQNIDTTCFFPFTSMHELSALPSAAILGRSHSQHQQGTLTSIPIGCNYPVNIRYSIRLPVTIVQHVRENIQPITFWQYGRMLCLPFTNNYYQRMNVFFFLQFFVFIIYHSAIETMKHTYKGIYAYEKYLLKESSRDMTLLHVLVLPPWWIGWISATQSMQAETNGNMDTKRSIYGNNATITITITTIQCQQVVYMTKTSYKSGWVRNKCCVKKEWWRGKGNVTLPPTRRFIPQR